jgi:hypothetical protein
LGIEIYAITIVALLFLSSFNAFLISQKFEYYHLMGQLLNLVEVAMSFTIIAFISTYILNKEGLSYNV